MAETYHLRMARCSEKDIEQMRNFLFKLEELLEECDDSFKITDFLEEYYDESLGRHWQRLISGYETMFENACNPNLDYLAWKPEIQEALTAAQQAAVADPPVAVVSAGENINPAGS